MRIVVFSIAVTLFVSSCSIEVDDKGESTTNTDSSSVSSQEASYKCPMDCENGKTYSEAGICPVCKMDLEKE